MEQNKSVDMAVDTLGGGYVADTRNNQIKKFIVEEKQTHRIR